jgi:hypothetical protein
MVRYPARLREGDVAASTFPRQGTPAADPLQPHAKPIRPAWQAADRVTVKCDDYLAHRAEHRRFEGLWRCFACYPIGSRP